MCMYDWEALSAIVLNGEDGCIDNFSCVCVVVMRVEEVDSFTTHLYNPPLHTHFKSERE